MARGIHYLPYPETYKRGPRGSESCVTACNKRVTVGRTLILPCDTKVRPNDGVTCRSCLTSNIFKTKQLQFEIGYDGDIKKWINDWDNEVRKVMK